MARPLKRLYHPKNPSKWVIAKDGLGRGKIVTRSSWEYKFCVYADNNPSIICVASEPFSIPYICPTDGKQHKYYIDFAIIVKDKNGIERKKLVEIKPHKETLPPKIPKRKTPRYMNECATYAKNKAKWLYAKAFCDDNNMDFVILDEYSLGIAKRKS